MKKVYLAAICAFMAGAALGYWRGTANVSVEPEPVPAMSREVLVSEETPPATPGRFLASAPPIPVTASVAMRPRVVFVIDDWGYHTRNLETVKAFDATVTLAVLPNLPATRRVAEEAHAAGHEIILHMPMEPKGEAPLEEDTLMVGMGPEDITERLEKSFASLPHIRGLNNHMGSRATEDPDLMRTVLETAHAKGYFFMDSVTSGASVAHRAARETGARFLSRDVFLDNEMTAEAIQARIEDLKQTARQKGFAIGIGHDKELTLEVIQKNIPLLKDEGFEIVSLTSLLEETHADPGH